MTLTNSTSLTARAQNGDVTDETDPTAAPTRRTFTPDQKLAILAAYEDDTESGAKGAVLRRRGSTAPRSPSGARPETPEPSGAPRGPCAVPTGKKPTGCARRTNAWRPNWPRPERRSTSW